MLRKLLTVPCLAGALILFPAWTMAQDEYEEEIYEEEVYEEVVEETYEVVEEVYEEEVYEEEVYEEEVYEEEVYEEVVEETYEVVEEVYEEVVEETTYVEEYHEVQGNPAEALAGQWNSSSTWVNFRLAEGSDEYDLVMNGQGEYSTYEGTCTMKRADKATCMSEGIRTSDGLVYEGYYAIEMNDAGFSWTWSVTYTSNGENYDGTTQFYPAQ